jgi:hypothetical protein
MCLDLGSERFSAGTRTIQHPGLVYPTVSISRSRAIGRLDFGS